jgi:hypothetical protein
MPREDIPAGSGRATQTASVVRHPKWRATCCRRSVRVGLRLRGHRRCRRPPISRSGSVRSQSLGAVDDRRPVNVVNPEVAVVGGRRGRPLRRSGCRYRSRSRSWSLAARRRSGASAREHRSRRGRRPGRHGSNAGRDDPGDGACCRLLLGREGDEANVLGVIQNRRSGVCSRAGDGVAHSCRRMRSFTITEEIRELRHRPRQLAGRRRRAPATRQDPGPRAVAGMKIGDDQGQLLTRPALAPRSIEITRVLHKETFM